MDPQYKILVQHTYEAVIDASVNPKTLRGSQIGEVVVGAVLCRVGEVLVLQEDLVGRFRYSGLFASYDGQPYLIRWD